MSRVEVPADFGVENIDSAVQGNVTLLLSDGLNMKANSIILAFNSPVFKRIFIEQEQSTVDFKTFDAPSIRLFIRSLYSGKCHFALMTVTEVDEVMEASEAMDVVWLKVKCEKYLAEHRNSVSPAVPIIERPSRSNSSASTCRESTCRESTCRESTCRENTCNDRTSESNANEKIVKRSLSDLKRELSGIDLKLKATTPSSEEIPTTSDETRTTCSDGSAASRGSNTSDYKRIRRTVQCSSESSLYGHHVELDSAGEREGSVSKRHRYSESDTKHSDTSSQHSSQGNLNERRRSLVSLVTTPLRLKDLEPGETVFRDCNPELPNLFHNFTDTLGTMIRSKTQLGDILEVLKGCREVKSLYMLFEALDLIEYNKNTLSVSHTDLKLISELRRRKRWGRVSPHFLENCSFYNRHFVDSEELAKERKELTSRSDSKKISDSLPPYSIRLEDLLRSVRVVEFQFKHPDIETCTKHGKCGFLLQLTGETQRNRATQRDRSTLLHIRLLRNSRFYTNSKVHYHEEVMSPDKMHLVVEEHFTTKSATSGDNRTTYVSWRGKPHLDRGHKSECVTWGDLLIPSQRHVKLVVYYDLTKAERANSPRCRLTFNRSKRKSRPC